VPGLESRAIAATPLFVWRSRRALHQHFTHLFQCRELLLTWTQREIKIRYKQAALGSAWAIMQPLGLMMIFNVVFTQVLVVPTDGVPYPLFSMIALIPWLFFANSIGTGVSSVVNNMALVTKVSFPREILALAQVGAAALDFGVACVVFVGMLLLYQKLPSGPIWLIPPILIIQVALTTGLVLLVSAATVRFRDVRFVVPLCLQIWLYVTPVIYPLSAVPSHWQWVLRMNPMTAVIDGYREIVLFGRTPAVADLASAAIVSAVVLVFGYWYFKHVEIWFADIS
jgi:lipopolysaccharide transport system permease protein